MLDQERIAKMKCGIFKGKSFYVFRPSVLKSGVCKYYRRGIFDKFRWCIIEMLIFGYNSDGDGAGLVTNITNRMKILLMEEIVFDKIGNIAHCVKILNSITEEKQIDKKITGAIEFCRIVEGMKRGRLISYINNWWRYSSKSIDVEGIKLKQIQKYAKKDDSELLLKYGELFIECIEKRDERLFGIYDILYKMEGKFGLHEWMRRRDAVYLLLEIVKDRFCSNLVFKSVFDFGMVLFNRKGMVERRAFGAWLLGFVWKWDDLDFSKSDTIIEEIDINTILENHKPIQINEDFVVNDWHVNKKFGKEKFGKVGAFVVDECLELLGENGERYRKFYVDCKAGKAPTTTKKKFKVKVKTGVLDDNISSKTNVSDDGMNLEEKKKTFKFKFRKKPIVKEANLPLIDWLDFSDVEVLDVGVCGLKVCRIKAKYNGQLVILKEMRESFRFGRDYMCIDSLKTCFGVKELKMKRIRSNQILDRVDRTKKTLVNNWRFIEKEAVYCMMDCFENVGDLGKNKQFLQSDIVFKEALKIMLYDGLFRSSDNIIRNILVNSDGELLSIDEGDIFGKRARVFSKRDWFLKTENIEKTKKMSTEIINEWNLEDKIKLVESRLKEYDFIEEMISEAKTRFRNYMNIINSEFSIDV